MILNTTLSKEDVKKKSFGMPLLTPAYASLPLEILNRTQLSIIYRTDLEAVRRIVPEPLTIKDPIVGITFLDMDIPGLGRYAEVSQSVVAYHNEELVSFRPMMFADNVPAILIGREVWGLPKKLGQTKVSVNNGTLIGTLDVDGVRVATGTMGYEFERQDLDEAQRALMTPCVVLKSVPHVDGTIRILELVKFSYSKVTMKEAWSGPVALELHAHAMAPFAEFPVREIVSASHTFYDATLPAGEVAYDYLATGSD